MRSQSGQAGGRGVYGGAYPVQLDEDFCQEKEKQFL